MTLNICIDYYYCRVDTFSIEIVPDHHYELRKPHPHPDVIPKGKFRCFVCQELLPERLFGDYICSRKVCLFCFPYVDEGEVAFLVAFDKAHGYS